MKGRKDGNGGVYSLRIPFRSLDHEKKINSPRRKELEEKRKKLFKKGPQKHGIVCTEHNPIV